MNIDDGYNSDMQASPPDNQEDFDMSYTENKMIWSQQAY